MPKSFAKGKSSLTATIKDQSGAGKTRIGEILSKEGQITSLQLDEALKIQKKPVSGSVPFSWPKDILIRTPSSVCWAGFIIIM